MNVADDDSGLSEHDRRAIAEIRRELDAEFKAEPAEVPPSVRPVPSPVPSTAPSPVPSPRVAAVAPARTSPPRPHLRRRERRRWSTMAVVLAFVTGAVSSAAGVLFTLVTLHPASPVAEPSGPTGEMRGPPPPAPPPVTAPGPVSNGPGPTTGSAAESDSAPAARPRASPTVAETRARREVRTAVFQWIEAQRRADLTAQMHFYPRTVPVFYQWRDVDRSAVRAEKARVFGGASTVQISIGEPTIAVDVAEGRARTRFRKRYAIQDPHVRRRGEVVQELGWLKQADGWKIVAERDVEVLASDPPARPAPHIPTRPSQGP